MALVLIPRILLERRHPGATVAWILAVGLIPYLGVPLYFLIGGRMVRRVSREKHWSMTAVNGGPDPSGEAAILPGCRKITRLLMRSGAFQLTMGNKIRVLDDGVETYETLVSLLGEACSSIEIATFILGRDDVGRSLVRLLSRKAEEGVEVRLLLDALGSLRTRGKFVQPIRDAGGRVGIFLPILPIRRKWSANLRNHRKLAVIDRHTAVVGGMNLAMEYMGPEPDEGRWRDVSMKITGNAVRDLLAVFRQDWVYSTGEAFDYEPEPHSGQGEYGGSMVQVVGDGPDINERPLYSGVLAALSRARESIWVATPYFVPDEPLSSILALSARMGLDVRIVIPGRSNHPLIDLAGRSFFPDLLAAGVRFYLYGPGMLHAKLIVIDGQLAVLGSANMDVRSFNLNFEIATFLYSEGDIKRVADLIRSVMSESKELTRKEVADRGKIRRFAEDICRVFSPLL